jgi:hypothetical protein
MYASSRQRFEYIHENMKNMKPWNPYLAKLIYIWTISHSCQTNSRTNRWRGFDETTFTWEKYNPVGENSKVWTRALITILYYLLHTDPIRRME